MTKEAQKLTFASVFVNMLLLGVLLTGCAGLSPGEQLESSDENRSLFGSTTIDQLGRNKSQNTEDVRTFAAQDERGLGANGSSQRNQSAIAAVGDLNVVAKLPPPHNSKGGTLQFISPNDKLSVDVLRVDELDRSVEVDSTGNISLPLIGELRAAGKTRRQLEDDLVRLYGSRYLESPQITVNVTESAGQRVTVDGEIRRAGIYPITSGATLLRAVSLAQGLTHLADPTKVYVFREVNGQRYVANFDVDAIRAARRPDPTIYGGDVVVVFQSSAKVAMENLKSVLGVATSAGRLAVLP